MNELIAAIEGLLETSGLNEDAIEPEDQLLVDNAEAVLAKYKATGLETPRMLVLSTSHIERRTATLLENDEAGVIRHEKGEYGWIIPILDINQAPANLTDLVGIYQLAEANGCTWIMLDRDADVVDVLPSYDW